MTTIVQIEYRATLLSTREEILRFPGHLILSVLGSGAAHALDPSGTEVGVVVVGHGAPWQERSGQVGHFKRARRRFCSSATASPSEPVNGADYNGPADDLPRQLRPVSCAPRGAA